MKIACLGWGSLIWRPESLPIQNKWFEDGPILPIEFARISSDDRVTLIIDNKAKPIRTLWSLMTTSSLDLAIEALKQREGAKVVESIHFVKLGMENLTVIQKDILKWIIEKNLDAAIWTGLSYSNKTKNKKPSCKFIINHLSHLDYNKKKNAEEYIRRAPIQIDTEYRRQIEAEFGWTFQS
jgi:hypothetical protein